MKYPKTSQKLGAYALVAFFLTPIVILTAMIIADFVRWLIR